MFKSMFNKWKNYRLIQGGFVLLMLLTFYLLYEYRLEALVTQGSKDPLSISSVLKESERESTDETTLAKRETEKKDYIKWVEFNVTAKALEEAYQADLKAYEKGEHLSWIDLLAYLGTKYGGDFKKYSSKDLSRLIELSIEKEQTVEELGKELKHFSYYQEAYSAILGGFVGEYEIQIPKEENSEEKVWVKKYGLKGFSPIAKGYEYHDFDDFGVSRSYGYKRRHLGHDMMGQVGTPITAVESGYVEAIGWNQYGGWRLGIRSFDKKRYYYYAHLRKNFPYNKTLEEGSVIQAGDVIGYLGRTGYSATENTNNIETSHLHLGLQLIFDESQKEGNKEIWVNCYELIKFLNKNRSFTLKDEETKEYHRVYDFRDPKVTEYLESQ